MELKNKSQITRSTNSSKYNFTPIANSMIQSGLSFEAIGLISYIISLPESWIIYKEQIQKTKGMGRAKFDRIWNECVSAGFIHSKRIMNNVGQFAGWSHDISDTATPLSEKETTILNKKKEKKTDCGKTDIRLNRHSENHTLYKTYTEEKIEVPNTDVKRQVLHSVHGNTYNNDLAAAATNETPSRVSCSDDIFGKEVKNKLGIN